MSGKRQHSDRHDTGIWSCLRTRPCGSFPHQGLCQQNMVILEGSLGILQVGGFFLVFTSFLLLLNLKRIFWCIKSCKNLYWELCS